MASLTRAFNALRKQSLAYPQTREDFPWGHSAFKVQGKVFLFLHREPAFLSLSVKLPQSAAYALRLPFAEPTGYGLGRHGWITARFVRGENVPLEMLADWVDESFRAVTPKRLLKS